MTRKTSKRTEKATEEVTEAVEVQDPDATAPSDPATDADDGDGHNDDVAPPEGNESARAGKVRDPEAEGEGE